MDTQLRLTGGNKFGTDGMNNVALLIMLLVGYVAQIPPDLRAMLVLVLVLYAAQAILFRGVLMLAQGRNWFLRQMQSWLFIYTIAGYALLVFKGTALPMLEYALGGVFLLLVLNMMFGGN